MNMEKLRFAHLSDTHILREYKGSLIETLTGVDNNPTETLKGILQAITQDEKAPDFILISGDLVHEGTVEDYAFLAKLLEDHITDIPYYLALGNHDVTEAYWEGVGNVKGEKRDLFYEAIIQGYRLIVLDSSYDHSGKGVVSEEQLQWLKETLAQPAPNGSIVVVHHPLEAGHVVDGHSLSNSAEVLAIIKNTDVKLVLSGHTHQNKVTTYENILLSTAGGTSFSMEIGQELASFNNRTGYSICTLGENGASVEHVRYPDKFDTFLSVELKQMLQHS